MRKVLSFVLVLALVLSSFSMAFAADTTTSSAVKTDAPVSTATSGLSDISASANSQAITVANNLGIVTGNPDGTFQPEKAVTRAEFAAMITRALGIPQSALAGYTSTSFKDTSGYGWAVSYLAFCQSKGIMLGDGAGNAMPGKTINTNEAATMICRALGYTANSSQLTGVWPANYVSLAQDLGIYDDTAKATSVDKQNAAQMIYNALTAQKVQVASDGTTTKLYETDGKSAVTMLTSGLNCENKGYQVITYDADAVINTLPYVGKYAKVYENSDDKIVAIDDVKSTTLKAKYKGSATTSGAIASGEIFKDENADIEYTIKDIKGKFQFYPYDKNGTVESNPVEKTEFVNGADNKSIAFKNKEYTLNVKLSNKNIVEVYSIMDWAPDGAAKVVAGDLASIKDGKLLGYDFTQDKNDKIVTNSFELVGVKSLNDIKADNVVYVYKDADRKEISRVVVGTQVVEGTLTKINKTDEKWTVGGKTYKFAMTGENGSSKFKDTELNNAVKLYLDGYGDIYKYDVTSGSAKDYASVVAYDKDGTSGGNIKIYKADDSKKTYPNDLDNFDAFANTIDSKTFGKRLIGYSLNKSGEIDGTYPKFAKGAKTVSPEWGDNDIDGWYAADKGLAVMPSNTVLKHMNPVTTATKVANDRTLVVDPDAVVLTYDTEPKDLAASGSAVEVNGVSKVANIEKDSKDTLDGQVEVLVRDGKVVAMIVAEDDCSGSTTDSYAVVSDTDQTVNSVGDKALSLTGFIDNKEVKADKNDALTSGTGTVTKDGATGYSNVNVYKLRYNDDKNISKMDAVVATGAAAKTKVLLSKEIISEDGYPSDNYIKTNDKKVVTGIASDAVWYEVKLLKDGSVDEYKQFNGTYYPGMEVWAYETNDDKDGADIVIVNKGDVKPSYTAPTLTFKAITPYDKSIATGSAIAAGTTIASITFTTQDGKTTGDPKVTSDGFNSTVVGTGGTPSATDFTVSKIGDTFYLASKGIASNLTTTGGSITIPVVVTDGIGNTVTKEFKIIVQ